MEANPNRVHLYHADASAFGGEIQAPVQQQLPVHAPVSLPPVGGHAVVRTEGFHLPGIVSFGGGYSQVAGSIDTKDGSWTTVATSVVTNLNVHDILTVERIVSQIVAHHPYEGYEPKVSFVGTRIDNLCIAGCPLKVVLNLGICSPGGDEYPAKSCFDDDRFLAAVGEQKRRMTDEKELPEWIKNRKVPEWVRARSAWDNSAAARQKKGFVLCSLVKEIQGEFPGRVFGNVLEIPELGKIHLMELVVDHNTFRVIGMRLELGCATKGSASVTAAAIEGRTEP